MAVSKRVRYEVLRRDNHACRYCGAHAPEVVLTVDHVVPSVLGGSDDPSNLVAACRDCNAGKTSSAPDAPLVTDADDRAARWSAAMATVAQERARDRDERQRVEEFFYDHWEGNRPNQWHSSDLPADWYSSVHQIMAAGLELDDLAELVLVAFDSQASNKWKYFCGCCWTRVRQSQERAMEIVRASDDPDGADSSAPISTMWTAYEMAAIAHKANLVLGAPPSVQGCAHGDGCSDPVCLVWTTGYAVGREVATRAVVTNGA